MNLGDFFVKRVPGFVVGDVWNSRPPETVPELELLVFKVVEQLVKHLPTEQDVYWFVIEEYDHIVERAAILPTLAAHFPLFEIEHLGRRSANSYVGKPNPGVVFLNDKVSPPLTKVFGETMANQVRSGIYTKFRELAREQVNSLRRKYAVHYRNNCIASNSYHHAELWDEVIDAIEN